MPMPMPHEADDEEVEDVEAEDVEVDLDEEAAAEQMEMPPPAAVLQALVPPLLPVAPADEEEEAAAAAEEQMEMADEEEVEVEVDDEEVVVEVDDEEGDFDSMPAEGAQERDDDSEGAWYYPEEDEPEERNDVNDEEAVPAEDVEAAGAAAAAGVAWRAEGAEAAAAAAAAERARTLVARIDGVDAAYAAHAGDASMAAAAAADVDAFAFSTSVGAGPSVICGGDGGGGGGGTLLTVVHELLYLVRFPLVHMKYLRDVVEREPLFASHPHATQLLDEAYRCRMLQPIPMQRLPPRDTPLPPPAGVHAAALVCPWRGTEGGEACADATERIKAAMRKRASLRAMPPRRTSGTGGGGVLAGVEATPVAAGGLTRSQPVASPLATPSFRRTRATQARAPTVAKPPPKMR